MGRVKVSRDSKGNDIKKMYKEEEKNTFDLSYFLFKDQFPKINLEIYIKSLEQLSYPKESEEDGKRLKLHYLFTKMLDFLKNTELSEQSK
jgi:hypothetical protein